MLRFCTWKLNLLSTPHLCVWQLSGFRVSSSRVTWICVKTSLSTLYQQAVLSDRRLVPPALAPFRDHFPSTLFADPGPEQEEIEMLRQQLAKASLEASDSSGGAGVSRAPNTAKEDAPGPSSGRLVSEEVMKSSPRVVVVVVTANVFVHHRLQRYSVRPRIHCGGSYISSVSRAERSLETARDTNAPAPLAMAGSFPKNKRNTSCSSIIVGGVNEFTIAFNDIEPLPPPPLG